MSKAQDMWDSFTQLTPQDVGRYWSGSNAEFEGTQPNIGNRLLRAVNPVYSMGSALGAMHDSASEGNKLGMALAAYQALPALGALRVAGVPAMGALKASAQVVPSLWKTLSSFGGDVK